METENNTDISTVNSNDPIKLLEQCKEEASGFIRPKHDKWEECERFYAGDQWKFAKNRPVKNLVRTKIEGIIPLMVDSEPGASIIPHDQDRVEDAKVLESAIKYVYRYNSVQLIIEQAVRSCLKSRSSYVIPTWNPDGDDGEGSIELENINWRFVLLSPDATSVEKSKYVIFSIPKRMEELKRQFPKKAKKLDSMCQTTTNEESFSSNTSNGASEDKWFPAGISDDVKSKYQIDGMVIYDEMWIRDYSTQKIPMEQTQEEIQAEFQVFSAGGIPEVNRYQDHPKHIEAHKFHLQELQGAMQDTMAQQDPVAVRAMQMIQDHTEFHGKWLELNPNGEMPKYERNMRVIKRVGDVLLYDGEPDVDLHGMYPIIPFYAYKEEDDAYGSGESQPLVPVQKSFNEMDWHELEGLRTSTNPGWIIDQESGVDEDNIPNTPGMVLIKKQGTEVQRINPGSVSPQLAGRKMEDLNAIDLISGTNEQSAAKRPIGITSKDSAESMAGVISGRQRLKTRRLEQYSMPLMAKLVAYFVAEYWSTERLVRVRDNEGMMQYVKFSPENMRDFKYDVEYASGSIASPNKADMFGMMGELLKMGVIDAELFVMLTDIPSKQIILEKIIQQKQQMMMMQQAQMMAGQPQPGEGQGPQQ